MKYVLAAWVGIIVGMAAPASALTRCDMTFDLEGWSVFYKEAHGSGHVRCDNGQEARVRLETRGGGVTFGRSEITEGRGEFSSISDIEEIFGNYANAEAHAGMGPSSGAQVVTKGSVSLALKGTGNGVDLGFAFGRFTIAPVAKASHHRVERDASQDQRADSEGAVRDEALPPPAAPEQGY